LSVCSVSWSSPHGNQFKLSLYRSKTWVSWWFYLYTRVFPYRSIKSWTSPVRSSTGQPWVDGKRLSRTVESLSRGVEPALNEAKKESLLFSVIWGATVTLKKTSHVSQLCFDWSFAYTHLPAHGTKM
jgi:hypothetical protein